MNSLVRFLYCVAILCAADFAANGQAPVANFTANTQVSCAPALIHFTDQSTNSPTSWNWDLGNGTTGVMLQNPSTTYLNPGTYTVVLTATNASGSNTVTKVSYITINASPTIAFYSPDTALSCIPKTVHFFNQSTGNAAGGVTYAWDFGDGATSAAQNPTHTYTTPGNYNVSLVVSNSTGCTNSLNKMQYVRAIAKPIAAFSASNNNGCAAPLTTTFINNSTGAANYLWLFGDGATSTSAAASVAHSYTSPGAYTVKLVALSPGGCNDTLVMPGYVNVGNLVAGFNAAASTCMGNAVNFTSTTVPAGSTSTWTFGDGGTATGSNVSHVYTAAGTYTVKMIANFNGCLDSATRSIVVSQRPTAQFSAPNTASCSVPFTASFNNTSVNGSTYAWDFGDGSTSTAAAPTHQYTSFGNYTVRLVVTGTNGCSDTLIRTAYINLTPITVSYTGINTNGCIPTTSSFTANVSSPSPIASYSWNFGDGATGSGASANHTYTAAGNYPVTLTVTTINGCTATAAPVTVHIGTKPNTAFTYNPGIICVEQGIQFTNTTTGAGSYLWFFGDGTSSSTATNPNHIYSAPGTYSVTLVSFNNGCRDTLVKTNIITVRNPLADFKYKSDCVNRKLVTFTNTSIAGDSYTWNFGDGTPVLNTTSSAPVTHTYAALGNYTVSLTTSNNATGCTSTKTMLIKLYVIDPSFTCLTPQICRMQEAVLVATATQPYPSYNWNFGDGQTASPSVNTFTHNYAQPGIYTVTLRLTDTISGCSDSLTKPNLITVGGSNVAFTGTPLTSCAPMVVSLTDQTASLMGVSARVWRFGDGTSQTPGPASTSHIYNNPGAYSVTLRVTDVLGCTDSLVKPAYVNVTKPVAAFTADTVACLGRGLVFANNTTGTAPITYAWTFGDGGTATTAAPSHTYNAPGSYTVRLIATDANGCKDTLTKSAYIRATTVTAHFTMSDSLGTCPPLAETFTNNSVGATSYSWDFGNGSTSNAVNPTNIYTQPGTYTIVLRAFNGGGCVDSFRKTITVSQLPSGTLSYSPTSGCLPLTVNFTSTNTNTSNVTWDFNNGITSITTANTTSYTYTQPGSYLPKAILRNGVGCAFAILGADTIRIIRVNAGFKATPNPVCAGAAVNFTDTSGIIAGVITTRSWDFGDGGIATGATSTHSYANPGTYNVRLIAGAGTGCPDTAFRTITVLPKPTIVVADAAICAGGTATLQASGADTYVWSPATSLSATTGTSVAASPAATTTYTITGTNTAGCVNTAQATVTVNQIPVVNAGASQTICNGMSAQLQASGANSYVWTPAATLSCAACANPVANPNTNTTYTVTGTSAAGCVSTAQVTVNVIAAPVLTVSPNQSVCAGGSVALSATGAASYSWSPATGLSCTTCANPTAAPATTTTYTVLGNTITNGCQSAGSVTITVNPLPTVSAGPTRTLCAGDTAQLQASGAATYSWSPATGLSCTTCSNPVASPAATTTYTVTGTSAAGCSNTAQVAVNINPLPTVSAGPDQTICTGGNTTLTATGATTYVWSPATGLSCTSCASPTATPAVTTTYIVTGTNANGCTRTDTVLINVHALPVLTTSGNQFICPGGTVTLTAGGANTYSWSPATGLSATTGASVTASPAATTTYTITGTGIGGCVTTTQLTVNVNSTPALTVSGNAPICAGGNVTLTASGANTYIWSPATGLNTTTGNTVIASPATTTTYTVTGTSGVGCSGTTAVTVIVNPLPTVSAGAGQAICAGNSTTLTATGAATYSWSPATGLNTTTGASVTTSPSTTATYTVTGTSITGCVSSAQVTVTVNQRPTITTANQSVCPGGSATLTASGAVTYSWSPANTLNTATGATVIASPAATTVYTVTGTAANGCTGTSTATVTVNSLPAVVVSGNNAICAGSSTTLTASGANSFSWSPGTGLSATTGTSVTASPAATTTYTVTGTNGLGCTNTTQFTVTVHSLPNVTAIASNPASCAGTSTTLTATGAAAYAWSPATGLSNTTGATTTATLANTTTYIVTGTDAFGCQDTGTVTVSVLPLPAMIVSNDTSICGRTSVRLQVSGAATYSWSPATGLSCTTCAAPLASPATTTTYTVLGTGANGCVATGRVKVTIYDQPLVNAGPDQTICSGQSAQLQASGASSYAWTPAATLSCNTCANPLATPASTIEYHLVGTDLHGCTDSDRVVISVIQREPTSVAPNGAICEGETYQLTATGGTGYSWSPAATLSNATIASPVATPTTTTTYQVIISQGQCFHDTLPVTVTVHPKPTVDAGPDRNIIAGTSTVLQTNTTNAATFAWTPGDGLSCIACANPVATPEKTTTYGVRVKSDFGCEASDEVTVFVTCDGKQLWLPNTFTPNGDGQNDRFYPHGKGVTSVARFRIYDRWGELVYDMQQMPVDDSNYGWDGTYKNRQLKSDVYVYIINAQCTTGEPLEIKGDITLIR